MNRAVKDYLAGFAARFAAVMVWILVSALIAGLFAGGRVPTEGEVAFVMAITIGWDWVTEALEQAEASDG